MQPTGGHESQVENHCPECSQEKKRLEDTRRTPGESGAEKGEEAEMRYAKVSCGGYTQGALEQGS